MPDAYSSDEDGRTTKDKKFAALNRRYEEEKDQPPEQEKWESSKIKTAIVSFGNKDRKTREEKNYELLIDNQVDFVQSTILSGI